jgi:hypothetical protein
MHPIFLKKNSFGYKIVPGLKAELSVTPNFSINSYYPACDISLNATGRYSSGQIPAIEAVGEWVPTYTVSVNPKICFSIAGRPLSLVMRGSVSVGHAENTVYLDMRWAFQQPVAPVDFLLRAPLTPLRAKNLD